MNELFRKEVLDREPQNHLGNVFLSTPLSFWAITILLSLIVFGLLLAGIFGEYARKERVEGVVFPDKGLVQIFPHTNGSYEAVLVESGDAVEVGSHLLKVIKESNLENGDIKSQVLLQSMRAELLTFKDQLAELPKLYVLTKKRLLIQKGELLSEAERIEEQIDTQSRVYDLENGIFEKMQNLLKDEAASVLEVSSQENRVLAAAQGLSSYKNSYQKVLAQVKDIDSEISLLPHKQKKEENEFKSRISSIDQMMIRTTADRVSLIVSPIEGKIASVTAQNGQVATTQKTALSILPNGSNLYAQLFVPSRAAGFVREGQEVRLLYHAFPYQKFGFHEGVVQRVSKTVINSTDIAFAPNLDEPVFLVSVALRSQVVKTGDQHYPLQAGMSLSADLILEDRKIWEWAFAPFLGTTN